MKRPSRRLVVAGVVLAVAAFFLLPIYPKTEATSALWAGHADCSYLTPTTESSFYFSSLSYAWLHSGFVFVPMGSHLWWLPPTGLPAVFPCA